MPSWALRPWDVCIEPLNWRKVDVYVLLPCLSSVPSFLSRLLTHFLVLHLSVCVILGWQLVQFISSVLTLLPIPTVLCLSLPHSPAT